MWELCGSYVGAVRELCGSFVGVMWELCGSYVGVMWEFGTFSRCLPAIFAPVSFAVFHRFSSGVWNILTLFASDFRPGEFRLASQILVGKGRWSDRPLFLPYRTEIAVSQVSQM